MACEYTPPDWDNLPDIEGLSTDIITEGCVDGKGIYDVFMEAHRSAIHQEYAKQRIKGSDYSKVYLGGMQAAMQNAVGFALGKDEAATKAELAKYAIEKAKSEAELVGYQICKIQKEIELLNAQREMTAAQTWAEIAKTTPKINVHMKELLTGNFEGPGDATSKTLESNSLLGSQVFKIHREQNLLIRKEQTEQAQVSVAVQRIDYEGNNTGQEIPVTGTTLKERNLLQRQSDGFLRDAEAKVAKIAADAFSVQFSTTDGEVTPGAFSVLSLSSMLDTAYANVRDAEHATTPIDDT